MIEYHKEHLLALLEEMEKELKKNELFLKQENRFYSLYQYEPYRRLHGLLEEAKKTATWMKQE